MRWLLDDDLHKDRAVLIRPDSEYAMKIATGISTPTENKALAACVHALYLALHRARKGQVGWAHVKGHSKHTWNELADALAVRGSKSGELGGCMPGARWRAARADGDPWRNWEGEGVTWGCEGRVSLTVDRGDP